MPLYVRPFFSLGFSKKVSAYDFYRKMNATLAHKLIRSIAKR